LAPEHSQYVRTLGNPPLQPRQFAATIAVRSSWFSVAVKAEPIEET